MRWLSARRRRLNCAACTPQAFPAAVLLSDESRHGLDDGDEVEFVGLDGMDELALGGPRTVSVTGANTFIIPDDARTYGSFGSGYCRELPRRRTVAFRSLAEELQQPTLSPVDGAAASELHAVFCALDAHEVRTATRRSRLARLTVGSAGNAFSAAAIRARYGPLPRIF